MPNQLRRLLAANARKGEFRAEGDTIFIYDIIVASDADAEWLGGVSAEAVVRQMRAMSGPINVRINSPGGDVFAARAIQAAMEAHGAEITAYVDGYAASAASVIAAAADRCVMAQGAFLMIHRAWTITLGNAEELRAEAAVLEKIDTSIAETYAARSGQSVEHFSELMAAETWFTAQEAVDAGLASEIAEKVPKAAARWDLSAYASPPKVDLGETVSPEPPATEPKTDPAPQASAEDIAHRRRVAALRLKTA